jgi:hypothetical protein
MRLLGSKKMSGGKPHGIQKEILLKILTSCEAPTDRQDFSQISDRHQRQGGGIFSEDNPEGGIEVATKPPLGKCSINTPIGRAAVF